MFWMKDVSFNFLFPATHKVDRCYVLRNLVRISCIVFITCIVTLEYGWIFNVTLKEEWFLTEIQTCIIHIFCFSF